ncbi:hypothetical protein EBZ39_02940 [bacterium]|nr:hypothetical protein [bacterium]
MQALLYGNLTTGGVSETVGGGDFDWPILTEGDTVRVGLRFVERIDDTDVIVEPEVLTVRASLGKIDARPTAGQWALKLGTGSAVLNTNMTALIGFDVTASALQTAINNLLGHANLSIVGHTVNPPTTCTVEAKDGSFLVRFLRNGSPYTAALTLGAGRNSLDPVSFVSYRSYTLDDARVHEIRLVQSPVAFQDTWAPVVPDAPTLTVIRDGGEVSGVPLNEVQELTVPAAFRGAYVLKRADTFAESPLLSVADGPEEIASALTGLADDGGSFLVSNPLAGVARIEFSGAMGGIDQDPLEVEVVSAPPGDTTFELSLATAEVANLLRANPLAENLPLEIEVSYEGPDEEVRVWTYRTDVSLRRELISDGLATAQNIDWLRPPLPRDYVPFTTDQVITGSQHFTTTLGNGADFEFEVDHNLDTESLHLTLRQNTAGGKVLILGTDYEAEITSANTVTVTLLDEVAPSAGEYAVTISTAGPVDAFQSHTHTIEQIVDLQDILDGLGSRISNLEDLAPTGVMALAQDTGYSSSWTLPKLFELYPTKDAVEGDDIQALIDAGPAALPKAGGLLAAVHDASTENLPSPLPAISNSLIGKVYTNAGSSAVQLPGGLGRRGVSLLPGQFATCDGRVWYRVERFSTQPSYYPSDFSRTLFTLFVNERQLRLKTELSLQFALEVAVLKSSTNCQWVLVVETGTAPQDSSPGTPGLNLQNVVWSTTPTLEQRIIVTPVPCTHLFGIQVKRALVSGVDTLTLNQILYGAAIGGTAPASANFAIRARLIRFDTENSVSDPRGLIALKGLFLPSTSDGVEFPDVGKAVIRG